ncbi:MAG TPA: hypothetical protein DDW98_07610 [Gammaproteobacteria bacterium]|nr:hypothetical protein [Gammaproteobacteria bacterium]
MNISPGARVLIPAEERVIQNAEPCDAGGQQLKYIGISELVRHRDAVFLTAIDVVTLPAAPSNSSSKTSPPFTLVDRESEYRVACGHFERRAKS